MARGGRAGQSQRQQKENQTRVPHPVGALDVIDVDRLRPGRHPCSCQARIHELILNCMGCGKVVCAQEGSGPCFYCGTLVCTREEREIIDRGSKKSTELMNRLTNISPADREKALQFRNKLLTADADHERRNRVNDLESDYSSIENNPYLTKEEREAILRRREELRAIREQRRRQLVISIDIANMTCEEQKQDLWETDAGYDPVIRGILERSEDRRKATEVTEKAAIDAHWVPKGFVPKYDASLGKKFGSNAHEFDDVNALALQGEEAAVQEVERQGWALAVDQPAAACIASGKIRYYRWPEDVHLKGPLFIASSVKSTTGEQIGQFAAKYAGAGGSTAADASILDYSPGSVMGRAFLDECYSIKEFTEQFGQVALAGEGGYVLVFSACEPLTIPVPHIPPAQLYQLDHELRDALTCVFSHD